MHLVARETLPEPNSHGERLFFVVVSCNCVAAAVNLNPLRMSVKQFVLCPSFSQVLFSPHLTCVCCICRSKEQRKNHREQLLSPLVKQRKQPTSHIYIYTHRYPFTPFSPACHPVCCGFGITHRNSGWGSDPLWLNTRLI